MCMNCTLENNFMGYMKFMYAYVLIHELYSNSLPVRSNQMHVLVLYKLYVISSPSISGFDLVLDFVNLSIHVH